MLRSLLLWLSRNKTVRGWFTGWGFARRAARRFVAGETIEEAILAIRELSALGITATLDHLGENVETAEDAARAAEDYLKALDAVGASGVQSHLSIKLTALGLDLGDELCRANVKRILTKAQEIRTLVTIDMESTEYTDRTLALFRALRFLERSAGPVVKVELRDEQGNFIHAEVPHERSRELNLAPHDRVYVSARQTRVFVDDYSI